MIRKVHCRGVDREDTEANQQPLTLAANGSAPFLTRRAAEGIVVTGSNKETE